ncbi:MAG: hypothetical protein M3O02_04205 [Acidobacteriota bacterium]|nr:hypothetical protein [Acidobacteriota bacterium]
MTTKAVALTLALCFAGAATALAQSAQMGTWKLNEAKSKIPAGAVKNSTVVYEAKGDSIKVTTDGTANDGSPSHTEWTGKFDGKDYPLTGDITSDSRSYTKVNGHTLLLTNKKAGSVVATGRIVVSADGKVRTLTLHSPDTAGKKLLSTAIYDKQ